MKIAPVHTSFYAAVNRMADLGPEEWEAFFDILVYREVPKKFRLTDVGEIAREAYFINKGLGRVYFLKDGEEINANFAFDNEFIASLQSFLLKIPGRQAVETIEDCELLVINKARLDALTAAYPRFNIFSKVVAERAFITLQQRAASFILDSPEERYMNMLRDRPNMLERVPQHMIASYLGITPVSLSRIRKRISG
jgi:CRP-like cAMP-binding protein